MHDTLVLVEAGNLTKAMISHEKALQWQELFCLAAQVEMADEDVIDMEYRVAGVCLNRYLMLMSLIFFFKSSEDLVGKKRHLEAARVLLDYSMDVREAVIALV